jgi:hypothetical protein
MTHDEMTAFLRGGDSFVLDEGDDAEIADRLDRYRDALERAREDINWLLSVQDEIPGARIGSQYLDEALK